MTLFTKKYTAVSWKEYKQKSVYITTRKCSTLIYQIFIKIYQKKPCSCNKKTKLFLKKGFNELFKRYPFYFENPCNPEQRIKFTKF